MGQVSWARNTSALRAGTPADLQAERNGDVVSMRNEGTVPVFVGRFVVQGTADDYAKIQDSGTAGGTYAGLAVVKNNDERQRGSDSTAGYAQNLLFPVAKTERWVVETEGAVTKDSQVFVRFVAGAGGSVIGVARADADTASAEAVNATFAETTTSAGLAKVTLSFNQV